MPTRNGAKHFLQMHNDPRRMLPERGLSVESHSESRLARFTHEHAMTLWLLAVGALACFLGSVVIASHSTRRD
jgi:hypothetical protein